MKQLNKKLQAQFDKMQATGKLFRAGISGIDLWTIYVASFEDGDDPVFRDPQSTTHQCNLCNNFLRRYGNLIAINTDMEMITLFDFDIDGEFKSVVKALAKAVKESIVTDVFFETYNELVGLPYEKCNKAQEVYQLGIIKNVKRYTKEEAELYGVVKPNQLITFNHINLALNRTFVDFTKRSIESIIAVHRDNMKVFKRALDEISIDTFELVKDLINQGSLLDGTTHVGKVQTMLDFAKEYVDIPANKRDNWCWIMSHNLNIAKFRNELIGVLCTELAEGQEINKSCELWNKRVDPANYMKAVAPITKKQIAEAEKFVEENGYIESFNRRLATIDDIKATEILHISSGDGKIKKVSIFDDVKSQKSRHKRNEFKGVEEVTIDKFMKDILPGCTSVEALLQGSLEKSMVNLTTSNQDSKSIFKWDNNYSWTFNGDLAGKSQIKEAVKIYGGKVDGILRFSMLWAENQTDNSDLDAHCNEPDRNLIYYSNKRSYKTGGNLDIDITQPQSKKKQMNMPCAVENITYPKLSTMDDGNYVFKVNQFSGRSSTGFKAEIAFGDEIFHYSYDQEVRGTITVATVTLKDGEFTIKHNLECTEGDVSKEIYGLETNTFHKVNLVALSPNHWNDNKVGNKHYFFMLEGCESPLDIRSFHNENLIPELVAHRKVLDVLGNTRRVKSTKGQLAGLGFNSTVRDELLVRLQGNFKRVVKIKF